MRACLEGVRAFVIMRCVLPRLTVGFAVNAG
jgi:hypothetical protein